MPKLNPSNQIIATLCVDEQNEVVKILPGNACVRAHHEGEFKTFDYISVFITERMLMDMNAMMRSKWERAHKSLVDDLSKQQYPRTIDESF